jgi:hypothetical protein
LPQNFLELTGAISWNWYYNGNIPCNEGANSIAQLSDGSFGITGYVRKCTSPSVTGAADVFYLHINAGGIPALVNTEDISGRRANHVG